VHQGYHVVDFSASTTQNDNDIEDVVERQMILNQGDSEQKIEGGLRMKGCNKIASLDKPLVSVITVVLNGFTHIERCILSVIQQTYDNIEFIVIDGGSTDGTLDVIRQYDNVISYWSSEKDNGIYDAMTRGIHIASGNWVYLLGSDDVLLDSIATVAPYLKSEQNIYYGDVYFPSRHRIYDGVFSHIKLLFYNFSHQSIFFPRQLFSEYSFNYKYKTKADYELNMRLFCQSNYRFVYLPVLVAIFNDVDGTSSLAEDDDFFADKKKIIRNLFPYHLYLFYSLRLMLVGMLDVLKIKQLTKRILKL
jgi:glycosyltransferase involved in cell wall biosynthesis